MIPSEKPGKSFPAQYVASTSTTISLAFNPILDDGGLPITKYVLYRDDGNNDFSAGTSYDLTTLYTTLDTAVDTSLVKGKIYSFYIVAYNANGAGIPSDVSLIGLGSLPAEPNPPNID